VRTFLAADLDSAFLDEVSALGARLAAVVPRAVRARWVARDAMHVTVRFFGASSDEQVDGQRALVADFEREVGRAAPGARPRPARALRLTGFPNARRARVLVLAIDDDGFLESVAAKAERAAVALGFEPETRAFRPHLTFARMKAPADLRDLCETPLALPEARITSLTLYESKTLPTGPVYTSLARVEL